MNVETNDRESMNMDTARDYLQKYYGYPDFREGQKNRRQSTGGSRYARDYADGRRQIDLLSDPGALVSGSHVGCIAFDLLDEGSGGCPYDSGCGRLYQQHAQRQGSERSHTCGQARRIEAVICRPGTA